MLKLTQSAAEILKSVNLDFLKVGETFSVELHNNAKYGHQPIEMRFAGVLCEYDDVSLLRFIMNDGTDYFIDVAFSNQFIIKIAE